MLKQPTATVDELARIAIAEQDAAPATLAAAGAELPVIDGGPEVVALSRSEAATSFVVRVILPAIAAIYLLTCAVLMVRLARSLLAVAALVRQSEVATNHYWLEALERWHSRFGLRRRVQLRQSRSVSVPVVIGWRRPAILLPADLASKTDLEVIDAVLLHELTHVQRDDYAWNVVLRVVRAIYWPHPCAWLVSHFVRTGREAICDAVCVHWMGSAPAYRNVLIDIAASLVRRSEVAMGMAMASSSKLDRRLAQISSDASVRRGLLTRPARVVVCNNGDHGGQPAGCIAIRSARGRRQPHQTPRHSSPPI